MRGFGAGVILAAVWAGCVAAQTPPAASGTAAKTGPTSAQFPILSLDQEALFARSKFGQSLRAELAANAAAAETETKKIDAALAIEERDLTARRAKLPAAEFRALADAFDVKVQKLRAEREAASADLRSHESSARQKFIAEVTKIIGDYMVERGAVAIVDKQAIIVSLLAIDITAEVVARIDAVLGSASPAP